jgi:hypothetical protein
VLEEHVHREEVLLREVPRQQQHERRGQVVAVPVDALLGQPLVDGRHGVVAPEFVAPDAVVARGVAVEAVGPGARQERGVPALAERVPVRERVQGRQLLAGPVLHRQLRVPVAVSREVLPHEAVARALVPLPVRRVPAVGRVGDAGTVLAVDAVRRAGCVAVGHALEQPVHVRAPLQQAERAEVVVERAVLHHQHDGVGDRLLHRRGIGRGGLLVGRAAGPEGGGGGRGQALEDGAAIVLLVGHGRLRGTGRAGAYRPPGIRGMKIPARRGDVHDLPSRR